MTALKKLEINYEDKNKIILYDDVYEFEIYKKENKVLGKDKNWSKFELVQFWKL